MAESIAEAAAREKKKREDAAKAKAKAVATSEPETPSALTAELQREALGKNQSVKIPVVKGGGTIYTDVPETITDGGKNRIDKTTKVAPKPVQGDFTADQAEKKSSQAASMSVQLKRAVTQAGGDPDRLKQMAATYKRLGMVDLGNEIDRYLGIIK